MLEALKRRVGAAGEPFRLFFAPQKIARELNARGLRTWKIWVARKLTRGILPAAAMGFTCQATFTTCCVPGLQVPVKIFRQRREQF